MPICVALLRGVNAGQNILDTDRLREVCSEMRLKNVRTYVQSGTVVFEGQGSGRNRPFKAMCWSMLGGGE